MKISQEDLKAKFPTVSQEIIYGGSDLCPMCGSENIKINKKSVKCHTCNSRISLT
jgi:transposase-like protein